MILIGLSEIYLGFLFVTVRRDRNGMTYLTISRILFANICTTIYIIFMVQNQSMKLSKITVAALTLPCQRVTHVKNLICEQNIQVNGTCVLSFTYTNLH